MSPPTTLSARIRQLPPAVADAIAAGEVIERPASVVKELAENAVDAGARRIDISVDGGGVECIRVVDDGGGIQASDMRLAVARHATSKIVAASDLAAVGTLGFRGEALASIAAVADVTLTSRTADAIAANRLRVRASQVIEEGPAAGPSGTSVEVRDLFSSTPARLRFLRSARTEIAAAVRIASDLALAHPDVAVTCRADGRVALRTPGGSLLDACRAVLGAAAAELVSIRASPDEHGIGVSGLISEPRAHRAGRDGLVLVVNGRRVHNRALLVAVEEAYRGVLPSGRHPFGIVAVTIDPERVDVNVHPTKREVRFRDDRAVFTAVQRGCWDALGGAHVVGVGRGEADGLLPRGAGCGRDDPADGSLDPPLGVADAGPGDLVGGVLGRWGAVRPGAEPARWSSGHVSPSSARAQPLGAVPMGAGPGVAGLGPLQAIGQTGGTWMVAASPHGVVLVDPHAAHERVLYAELASRPDGATGTAGGSGAAQFLLVPVVVETDASGVARVVEAAGMIRAMGFEIAAFGDSTVRCEAIPAACAGSDPERLVRDLLDGLGESGGPASERRHRLAALVACHSAVRFGDVLGPDQQQRLLDRLAETVGGLTCPHGRPTTILLSDQRLRRAFGRPPTG